MMRTSIFLSLLFLALAPYVSQSSAATSSKWRGRAIYQLLTDRFALSNGSTTAPCPPGHQGFCGGTWRGIIKQLDYIQGMGFDAIWISPITKQIDDPSRAWHGYSQQDLYALNENFGTARDLKDLATALHKRKMYLMVDIVVNHFGSSGFPTLTGGQGIYPFDRLDDFHNLCFVEDYTNQTNVEKCWLGDPMYPLADVRTTSPSVRTTYNDWIQQLMSNYSIDGLRIDTVKHVETSFWPQFQQAVGAYAVGEVADGDVRYVCPYQEGLAGVLNYPMYYSLTKFFSNTSHHSADLIAQMEDLSTQCRDPSLMAPFSENHDQPRFANATKDMMLAMNALAFTMLADGIPIIYSGQEQHLAGGNDPMNREAIWHKGYHKNTTLYTFIQKLNRVRKHAIASPKANYTTSVGKIVYNDDHTLALKKGPLVAVYSNRGLFAFPYKVSIPNTGFGAKTVVTEVLSCRNMTTARDGSVSTRVWRGLPMVFLPSAGLKGSGICGR